MTNNDLDSLNLSSRLESVRNVSTEVWDFYKKWVSPYETVNDMENFDRYEFDLEVKKLRNAYSGNMFAQRLIDVFVLELRGN